MSLMVSVIMPAYNVEKYIQHSIDSVISQTLSSWELIITDDGSTDSTVSIVRKNQLNTDKIILIQQGNKKQAAARNAGLRIARGKWIAFLDSDDLWMPNKLEVQLNYQNQADVLYTGGTMFSDKTDKQRRWKTEYGFFSAKDMYMKLYTYNPIPNQGVLMKSEWISRIGYQNESMEVVGCEDWEYWIRLAKSGASFFGIEDNLFLYRVHANSTSRNRMKMVGAQLFAKYINLDYSLLDKSATQKHLKKTAEWLIDRLLEDKQEDEALQHIEMLKKVTNRSHYNLTRFFLALGINSKFTIYLVKPVFAIKALKRLYLTWTRA